MRLSTLDDVMLVKGKWMRRGATDGGKGKENGKEEEGEGEENEETSPFLLLLH